VTEFCAFFCILCCLWRNKRRYHKFHNTNYRRWFPSRNCMGTIDINVSSSPYSVDLPRALRDRCPCYNIRPCTLPKKLADLSGLDWAALENRLLCCCFFGQLLRWAIGYDEMTRSTVKKTNKKCRFNLITMAKLCINTTKIRKFAWACLQKIKVCTEMLTAIYLSNLFRFGC